MADGVAVTAGTGVIVTIVADGVGVGVLVVAGGMAVPVAVGRGNAPDNQKSVGLSAPRFLKSY